MHTCQIAHLLLCRHILYVWVKDSNTEATIELAEWPLRNFWALTTMPSSIFHLGSEAWMWVYQQLSTIFVLEKWKANCLEFQRISKVFVTAVHCSPVTPRVIETILFSCVCPICASMGVCVHIWSCSHVHAQWHMQHAKVFCTYVLLGFFPSKL